MYALISELLATLDDEIICHQEMKQVLTEEKEAVSFSRKDAFQQVQLKKESLVVNIQHIEKKRKVLVGQLAYVYGQSQTALTVSKLARHVDAPHDEELMARARVLRKLVREVQEKNRSNQLLIVQYLDLINGSLKFLTNLIYDTAIYQKPGTSRTDVGYGSSGGRLFCGTV